MSGSSDRGPISGSIVSASRRTTPSSVVISDLPGRGHSRHWSSLPLPQNLDEPLGSGTGHLLHCADLFEQMRGATHDVDPVGTLELIRGLLVHPHYRDGPLTHDQPRQCLLF